MKKNTKNDALFGPININLNFNSIEFNKLTDQASRLEQEPFYSQVSRLLRENHGKIDAIDETSSPYLDLLLNKIPSDKVQLIYLRKRTDVNNAHDINGTIDCSLHMPDGVLRITAHWTAYKPMRAQEIVESLLKPIKERDLLSKTYIHYGENDIEKISQSIEEASQELFRLCGHPGALDTLAEY